MTANDWLVVLVLTGVLVASIALDVVRRRMERDAAEALDSVEHLRLMDEIRRQP